MCDLQIHHKYIVNDFQWHHLSLQFNMLSGLRWWAWGITGWRSSQSRTGSTFQCLVSHLLSDCFCSGEWLMWNPRYQRQQYLFVSPLFFFWVLLILAAFHRRGSVSKGRTIGDMYGGRINWTERVRGKSLGGFQGSPGIHLMKRILFPHNWQYMFYSDTAFLVASV